MDLHKENKIIADICGIVRQDPDFDWTTMGRVSVKRKDNLLLFNYTAAAQYGSDWNSLEMVSRGLIINTDGRVIARPYPKFWNWLQDGRCTDAPISHVMEKMDGSLAIIYWHNDRWNVATRGSFDSEQAQWAERFLHDNIDMAKISTNKRLTFLAEIIYPKNRIVLDYGDKESLVLLDIRHIGSGRYVDPSVVDEIAYHGWERPKRYWYDNVNDIVALRETITDEGFVVTFEDGQKFKFKGEKYIEMHWLIHNLTWAHVVEAYMDRTWKEVGEQLPDEFHNRWNEMITAVDAMYDDMSTQIDRAIMDMPKTDDRKALALWIIENHPEIKSFLFAALDDKSTDKLMTKYLKENKPDGIA